jgi:ketosteroid isomerase-like protein
LPSASDGGSLYLRQEAATIMNDIYAINVAKTEFREGFNTGDIDRLMAIFHPDGFTDMSEGQPNHYGPASAAAWRARLAELFTANSVLLTPLVNRIKCLGEAAYDYGWHELTLIPKDGGPVVRERYRYWELWRKDRADDWKVAIYMTNRDIPEDVNGVKSSWFLASKV